MTYERSENLDRITDKTKGLSDTGDNSRYYGKGFKFAMYVRYSKTNGQPCIHEEWRILKSAIIRQKTGIVYMKDLANLDLENFFEGLLKKYISYDSIDKFKLGIWLLGLDGRVKPNKERELFIRVRATVFCRELDIKTFAELKQHINEHKKEIKKRGRRSLWDEKYLKCDPNKFKVTVN